MRRHIALVAAIAVLAATPTLALAIDLCITLDTSCCGEKVIAKDFGTPPLKNKCKAITGFMLPFFGAANGSACTSADGKTMFVEWTTSNASSNSVAIWIASIPLPLPGTGTGNVMGLQQGDVPGGTTGAPFSAAKCSVAVPN